MDLKSELKIKAVEIRKNKIQIKELQKNRSYAGNLQYSHIHLKRDYRHKHIAYCMLRGRTYEQIEQKCRENNKPNMDIVKEIMDEYSKSDVCIDA